MSLAGGFVMSPPNSPGYIRFGMWQASPQNSNEESR